MTTEYIYPPIPYRGFDWVAYEDPEGVCGRGETEQEAVADYHDQLEMSQHDPMAQVPNV